MSQRPKLTLSGFAYYKMRYLANKHNVEVGGWGFAHDEDKPLDVADIKLIKQKSTGGSIDFDDEGVVEYTEDMIAAGKEFPQFMRVWVHTHPGSSPHPSTTDRETFANLTDALPWVVMCIIAKEGAVYAEIGWRFGGQHMCIECDLEVDWAFNDWQEWDKEYDDNVVEGFHRKEYVVQHRTFPRDLHTDPNWKFKDGAWRYIPDKAPATEHDTVGDPPKPLGKAKQMPKGKRARRRERKRERQQQLRASSEAPVVEFGRGAIREVHPDHLPTLYDPDTEVSHD
jgi:proteasome lid subunit RPN8/RPN11